MIACYDKNFHKNLALARQLAAVHAPIHVQEGLIYHGGTTKLVKCAVRECRPNDIPTRPREATSTRTGGRTDRKIKQD